MSRTAGDPAVPVSPPLETRHPLWKRVVRRVLELVVAAALLVIVFSQPTSHVGLRYFLASVVLLLLCLSFLKKWPTP